MLQEKDEKFLKNSLALVNASVISAIFFIAIFKNNSKNHMGIRSNNVLPIIVN